MSCIRCDVVLVENDVYRCKICREKHVCNEEKCDCCVMNTEKTLVCTLTGKCFSQMICHSFDPHDEPMEFVNKICRRTQQNKNSSLSITNVHEILSKITFDNGGVDINFVVNKIILLWREIVDRKLLKYIRRNDKYSMVVATIFSLQDGLCNSRGVYIIKPSKLSIVKLNKKKKNDNGVQVKMIRYGQRLLRKAFKDKKVINNQIII